MAQSIVQGMFGVSPDQIMQQRQQAAQQQALQYAQLDPFQRAAMGMYSAGSQLAAPVGGMLGLRDPQMEQAQSQQSFMSQVDFSNPEAILAAAQRAPDPRTKIGLLALAQQQKAALAEEKLKAAQASQAEARAKYWSADKSVGMDGLSAKDLSEMRKRTSAAVKEIAVKGYEKGKTDEMILAEQDAAVERIRQEFMGKAADKDSLVVDKDVVAGMISPTSELSFPGGITKQQRTDIIKDLTERKDFEGLREFVKSTATSQPRPTPASTAGEVEAARIAARTPAEIAKENRKIAAEIDKEKRKIDAQGRDNGIGKEGADTAIDMALAGDPTFMAGWGRNSKGKKEILDRITQRMATGEITPSQFVDMRVAMAGEMAGARTLGTQAARIQLSASEANKMLDIVAKIIPEVNLTDYPSINKLKNAVDTGLGGPAVPRLYASINALINTYARAINPNGIATVRDKNKAETMINTAMANGQLAGVMQVMRSEMDAALAAPAEVRDAMKEERNRQQSKSPVSPAPTSMPTLPVATKKRRAEFIDIVPE